MDDLTIWDSILQAPDGHPYSVSYTLWRGALSSVVYFDHIGHLSECVSFDSEPTAWFFMDGKRYVYHHGAVELLAAA